MDDILLTFYFLLLRK